METKRYWQIMNSETNECFLTRPLSEPPTGNYVEFEEGVNDNFIRPTFYQEDGKSPMIVEGITSDESNQIITNKINDLKLEYDDKIDKVVRKAHQDLIFDEIPIPQEIIDERDRLRQEFRNKVFEQTGIDYDSYKGLSYKGGK